MSPAEQQEQVPGSLVDGGSPHGSDFHTAGASLHQASENVDKIRDILFGANMRDYDARFARLEECLMKETADLRESARLRFEAMENYVKKEIDALHIRIKSERDERSESLSQHSRESKESHDSLSRRVRDLDDRTASSVSDIRQDILNHSRNLMDELRARHEQISALIDRRFQELNHGKTDRAALASLLSEVAMRLKDEFRIPGAEG